MLKYFLKRTLSIIPVLFVVSILAFLFVHLLPGDPARMMAGEDADQDTVEMLRIKLGLDKPLPIQYFSYMAKVVQGDLGISLRTKLNVYDEIVLRYGPTMYLAFAGLLWSTIFGVFAGAIAAIYSGKWQDHLAMVVSVSGISIPQIWLGLLLIQLFSVHLGWLPVAGYTGRVSELILPSITLGAMVAAIMARFPDVEVEVVSENISHTWRARENESDVMLDVYEFVGNNWIDHFDK